MENGIAKSPEGLNRIRVSLRKQHRGIGFGFNIIGGTDKHFIPGYPDFFISRIKPDGIAAKSGRFSIGDRLVSINGIDLTGKTHDEAVKLFQNIDHGEVVLVLDKGAEEYLLKEASQIRITSGGVATGNTVPSNVDSASLKSNGYYFTVPTIPSDSSTSQNAPAVTNLDEFPALRDTVPAPPIVVEPPVVVINDKEEFPPLTDEENEVPIPKPVNAELSYAAKVAENVPTTYAEKTAGAPSANKAHRQNAAAKPTAVNIGGPSPIDDDAASTTSGTSVKKVNFADNSSSTSKLKPFFLDPAHNSILAEVFYVSVGAVALGAIIYAGCRLWKRS